MTWIFGVKKKPSITNIINQNEGSHKTNMWGPSSLNTNNNGTENKENDD